MKHSFIHKQAVLLLLIFLLGTGWGFGARDIAVITVSNEREFIKAIGPDRVIRLQPRVYNLSTLNPHEDYSRYLDWEEVFDGEQLVLIDLENLTIEGAGDIPARVVVEPRYAFVLTFVDSNNIKISNIEAGHTPEKGYCSGGVFAFNNCRGIVIDKSVLYGCGTEGLNLYKVSDLLFSDSVIKECTYDIMTIDQSKQIQFSNSKFFDNREFDLITIQFSSDISFRGCAIKDNSADTIISNTVFKIIKSAGISIRDTVAANNRAKYFISADNPVETANLTFEGNTFGENDNLLVDY